jgi:hypothetical protein
MAAAHELEGVSEPDFFGKKSRLIVNEPLKFST